MNEVPVSYCTCTTVHPRHEIRHGVLIKHADGTYSSGPSTARERWRERLEQRKQARSGWGST